MISPWCPPPPVVWLRENEEIPALTGLRAQLLAALLEQSCWSDSMLDKRFAPGYYADLNYLIEVGLVKEETWGGSRNYTALPVAIERLPAPEFAVYAQHDGQRLWGLKFDWQIVWRYLRPEQARKRLQEILEFARKELPATIHHDDQGLHCALHASGELDLYRVGPTGFPFFEV